MRQICFWFENINSGLRFCPLKTLRVFPGDRKQFFLHLNTTMFPSDRLSLRWFFCHPSPYRNCTVTNKYHERAKDATSSSLLGRRTDGRVGPQSTVFTMLLVQNHFTFVFKGPGFGSASMLKNEREYTGENTGAYTGAHLLNLPNFTSNTLVPLSLSSLRAVA